MQLTPVCSNKRARTTADSSPAVPMPERRSLIVWLAILLLVIIGELLPGDSAPIQALSYRFSDKLIHTGAYALLAAWPAYSMRFRTAAFCIAVAECIGITLEFAQHFIPNRSYDLYDMLANSSGILAGILVGLMLRHLINRMRA